MSYKPNTPYVPREGSVPDKAMGFIEANGGTLTTSQIAHFLGTTTATIYRCLQRCVENDMLTTKIIKNKRYYTLAEPVAAVPIAPPASTTESGVFAVALYVNGNLGIHGVQPNENGVIVLNAQQTAMLRGFVSGWAPTP